MIADGPPKIGLLGLMLELYDRSHPDLRPTQEGFAQDLVARLGQVGEVVYSGIQNTRQGVAEAVDRFSAEAVDLLVTVHFSYSPSLIALPELIRWQGPLVLWNTQRITGVTEAFGSKELLENHGMHGVQDLANTLVRAGRSFGVVTGHFEDEYALAELEDWALAARTATVLRRSRIGQVGFVFQDMGDFGVDETLFLAQVGPHVIKVRLDLLAEAQQAAPGDELERMVAADREAFEVDENLTHEEHLASARIEWAVREVVSDLDLGAIAVHYEALSADPRFGALPFAAAAKLLGEGYGFGGEGDVTSAAAVLAMRHLCGIASFAEMFTMDFDGDAVYMAHYAEANPRLARRDRKPKLVRREGWVGSGGVSTSLAFAFEPGPATLVNLTLAEAGLPKIIVTEGYLEPFVLAQYDTPHCKFSPSDDLAGLLDAYVLEGGSHHLALSPGEHAGRVQKLAAALGVASVVI
jgi:L-arabinose isomerase